MDEQNLERERRQAEKVGWRIAGVSVGIGLVAIIFLVVMYVVVKHLALQAGGN